MNVPGASATRPSRVLPLMVLLAALCTSAAADEQVLQLPNLVPLRPYNVQIGLEDHASPAEDDAPRAIRFSISTVNRGAYALELAGDPEPDTVLGSGSGERAAHQCVWWVSRVCTTRQPVGTFRWHEEHRHWHFEDYASYELRRVQAGLPDMSPGGLVGPGQKASFCLLDSWRESEPPGHDPLAPVGVYATCTNNVEGISPGWADEYGYLLSGQQIPIPPGGLSDGTYAVIVRVNPEGRILESDLGDNTAWTIIQISSHGTVLRVLS